MSMNINLSKNKPLEVKYNIDNDLAIYIPFIAPELSDIKYIKKTFQELNIAIVKKVKFKKIVGGYECYINMEKWFNNFSVHYIQDMIVNNINGGRIVHDDPYYWVLLPHSSINIDKDNKDINYYSQISQNREVNNSLIYRLNNLEEKNLLLEKKLNNVLSYCYFKDNKYSQLLGGCGAITNAWCPSQPSQPTQYSKKINKEEPTKNIKTSKHSIKKSRLFSRVINNND